MAIASAMIAFKGYHLRPQGRRANQDATISGSIRPFILRYPAMPMHCQHFFRFKFSHTKKSKIPTRYLKVFTNLSMQISGKKGEGFGTLPASCICFFQRIVKRLAISGGEMLS